jgi:predicted N-acyltransferase
MDSAPPPATSARVSDGRSLELRLLDGLAEVAPETWDALANPLGTAEDPFLCWAFLEALERSGSVGPGTGWSARHLALKGPDGALLAAAPCYLKSHSQGEYVFDHSWADAWRRAGGRYYPKLQVCVPFTPVPGRRLLSAPDATDMDASAMLAHGLGQIARESGLSSAHVTFCSEAEAQALEQHGWLRRTDQQFHFFNRGYRDFDDFLDTLSSEKRKNLRKERQKARQGLEIERLTGADLTEAHWDAFFDFYMDTGERKWGTPYLNRRFFRLLHERMADRVLLIMARRGERWIAGALNLIGSDALYGRHWGRVEDQPFLHFELCYYQAMDEVIARGLSRAEAGAQGGHKLARGYEPVKTHSAHWIVDPGFRAAVADFLERERRAVDNDIAYLETRTPFRKDG